MAKRIIRELYVQLRVVRNARADLGVSWDRKSQAVISTLIIFTRPARRRDSQPVPAGSSYTPSSVFKKNGLAQNAYKITLENEILEFICKRAHPMRYARSYAESRVPQGDILTAALPLPAWRSTIGRVITSQWQGMIRADAAISALPSSSIKRHASMILL